MATIKLELSPDDLQIIVQALDAYVRQNGLQVAINTALIYQKLERAEKLQRVEEVKED